MSDQEDEKKNITDDTTTGNSENQSKVDENNQPEGVETQNNET